MEVKNVTRNVKDGVKLNLEKPFGDSVTPPGDSVMPPKKVTLRIKSRKGGKREQFSDDSFRRGIYNGYYKYLAPRYNLSTTVRDNSRSKY